MYDIYPKNSGIEKDYDELITSLTEDEKKKLVNTLAKYPKGLARNSKTEIIGRVEKKNKHWQYYAPDGYRVIYDVSKKLVLILFVGDHEEAAIWLRKNAGKK